MKRFAVLIGIAACAVLTGCGAAVNTPDTSTTTDNQWFEVHHVPVDGRTVTCLVVMTSEDTFSCDWTHAK